MSEVKIRVAYVGTDHAGRATVMVSNDYYEAQCRIAWNLTLSTGA